MLIDNTPQKLKEVAYHNIPSSLSRTFRTSVRSKPSFWIRPETKVKAASFYPVELLYKLYLIIIRLETVTKGPILKLKP